MKKLLLLKVTDSPYVVASMGIMTRMGTPVLNKLAEGEEFVRCQHTLGRPLPLKGTKSKHLNEQNKLALYKTSEIIPFHCLLCSPSRQLMAL